MDARRPLRRFTSGLLSLGAFTLAAAACSSGGQTRGESSGPSSGGSSSSTRSGSGSGSGSSSSDPLIATGVDVTTTDGPVQGASASGARSWKGIPYAAPPTGMNRFHAPQPVASWTTPRDATVPGNECAQVDMLTGAFGGGDEDCLYLNVWSPDPAPKEPLPVMVWIHGGAYAIGSGSLGLYDGTALASTRNVVIVTINYRLGPLGFLGHSALVAEDPASGTGNYGMLDQRAALAWVQKNIHPFGGDARRVTLFGESAGGMSVVEHLVSPGSAGLFQRAIVESGAIVDAIDLATVPEAEAQADALATNLGCTGAVVPCLRSASFQDVTTALPNGVTTPGGLFEGRAGTSLWLPVDDGVFVPTQPAAAYASGAVPNIVPTIIGSNKIEGALFHAGILGDTPIPDEPTYEATLQRMFGANSPQVLALYPGASYASFTDALAQIETDALFACASRRIARALVKAKAPVFRYWFTRAPDTGAIASLGATHGAELTFVFGNNDPIYGGVTVSEPLSQAMMRYWTRHAASGDPNGAPDPVWPAYDAATDAYLQLDIPQTPGSGLDASVCDFWDGIPPLAIPKTY